MSSPKWFRNGRIVSTHPPVKPLTHFDRAEIIIVRSSKKKATKRKHRETYHYAITNYAGQTIPHYHIHLIPRRHVFPKKGNWIDSH